MKIKIYKTETELRLTKEETKRLEEFGEIVTKDTPRFRIILDRGEE